ncbi:peptidase S9 [Acrocarpospora phusangensis]|uniref:Peptidase S9 n=1 Tax=Acrocarpospora phusangensis TaxID=1070424 RepID=A0A919URL8_9ACTN|nr:S9 family peptidase [Acrocarpospora phusangensis]GIH28187.1 peptidase S9 [Acrocarpospora phusangensis]
MTSIFHDLRSYVAAPRVAGLRLSPDGTRLVAVVQSLDPDGKSYGTALWEIPLEAGAEPYRLTRSAKGEGGAEFTPDGELLFVSGRPDPAEKDGDSEAPALWLLPERGEARRLATRPGAITGVRAAGGTIVYAAQVLPGDAGTEADRRKARKEAGVSAVVYDDYPIRYWDHDLGPAESRLFLLDGAELTPRPGRALDQASFDVTPDGATVVTTWRVGTGAGNSRSELIALTGGERRVLAASETHDFLGPVRVSPDGRHVACVREWHGTVESPVAMELWVVDLATGEGRPHGGEVFPGALAWGPDCLYAALDHQGRRPVYRIPLDGGDPVRLTADDAAYAELNPAPDGSLYALRSAIDAAPAPVRITPDGTVEHLPAPIPALDLPGTLTEVTARAEDGADIRGWLVLPEGASAENPAPFLLWIHGGPLGSWNDWSWRWNPWIMAAHGYAVLLPDPCLSTGYGQAMIERGWGDWGPATFGDLMSITDAALKLPEIDDQRIAAMGGSFGGYMANWVAGHTDRFKAIVTHASLWNLEQFAGTTDAAMYWQREWGAPGGPTYQRLSPDRSLDKITTPMLVIHGDKDYRVPIGEALRLWWDLRRSDVESRFLYFPDEGHWITKPGNVLAWYDTVLTFLYRHVEPAFDPPAVTGLIDLGEEWATR